MARLVLLIILVTAGGFFAHKAWEEKPYILLDALRSFSNPASNILVDLKEDLSDYDEAKLQKRFSPVPFTCTDEPSKLGPRVCYAYVYSFNDIRADNVAFFFNSSGSAYLMRLEFHPQYHDAVTAWLNKQYTYLGGSTYSFPQLGQTLGAWETGAGYVGHLSAKSVSGDNSVLVWRICKSNVGCY